MNALLNANELLKNPTDWIILDCRHNLQKPDWGHEQYQLGHIPGAHFVHLDKDLSAPKTGKNGRHPLPSPEALTNLFRSLGINQNSQVVAYDDAGGLFAARAWWSLKWLGFDSVCVLNGGLTAWQKAGGELTNVTPSVKPGNFMGQARQEWLVDANRILSHLDDGHFLLVDARGSDRFRGENETIDPVGGHIPGAINRPFQQNLTAEGEFKSQDQLKTDFEALLSNHQGRQIVHQCGSGVSACHNWLAMSYAGLDFPLTLYPGSWSEWVSDPNRPIARG